MCIVLQTVSGVHKCSRSNYSSVVVFCIVIFSFLRTLSVFFKPEKQNEEEICIYCKELAYVITGLSRQVWKRSHEGKAWTLRQLKL